MKIKTNYSSTEFKERQGSFGFFCAWAQEFVLKFRKECRAGWNKLCQASRKIMNYEQLAICFNAVKTLTEWATWTPAKNHELKLKPIKSKKNEKPLTWAQLKKWETELEGITNEAERKLEIQKWIIEKNKRVNQNIEDSYKKPCKQ